MSRSRVTIRVQGRVQGVWFRASTRDFAAGLGLTGFVRNLADGSVEVVAEGDEEPLRKLLEWCQAGPPGARVDQAEARYEAARGEFASFRIVL